MSRQNINNKEFLINICGSKLFIQLVCNHINVAKLRLLIYGTLMKKFNRPRASTIGTPVYHRRRRDWKDDRDLLEEVAASVNRLDGPYDYYDRGVFTYREKIKAFRESGYENNKEVFYLGMWIREALSEISKTQASYDLRVHPISFPENLEATISEMENKTNVFKWSRSLDIS